MNVTRSNKVERHAGHGRGKVLLLQDQIAPPGLGQDTKHLQRHCSDKDTEDKPSPKHMSRDSIRGLMVTLQGLNQSPNLLSELREGFMLAEEGSSTCISFQTRQMRLGVRGMRGLQGRSPWPGPSISQKVSCSASPQKSTPSISCVGSSEPWACGSRESPACRNLGSYPAHCQHMAIALIQHTA